MSEMFRCGDHEALIEYLYGECEPGRREGITAHVAVCGSCAEEIASLGGTQDKLTAWVVPPVELGFRLPAEPQAPVLRPAFAAGAAARNRWWREPLPAWAQAAAAALIFVSGMAAGVSRGAGAAANPGEGASVAAATPSIPAAAPAGRVAPASVQASADVAEPVTARDLAAVEQRLRAELAHVRAVSAPTAAVRRPDDALLREVRTLIAESEQRQRNDVTLRLAQTLRTVEKQRQVDMTQVQWTVGQMQELTGAALRDQGAKVNMALRGVSFAR